MSFSIAARSEDGSLFGIAIASSSPAVGARCIHVRARVGAVATQNITDPTLGPKILEVLAQGASAQSALDSGLAETQFGAYRQLIAVTCAGPPAVHTGTHALGISGSAVGATAAAAGNLLANSQVPHRMLEAFERTVGHFGVRLLQALIAGQSQGGESGPIHSAALVMTSEVPWPIVDLRVDWDERDPLNALAHLWDIYAPQIDDYVKRALDPAAAPSFGVPADP